MAQWTLNQFNQALEERLDELQRGQIRLQDLPPPIAAWFFAGEAYGRASRQPEVDRLNHQLDAYWARAFLTNDERRERILQRLDRGLQEADDAAWERIEQELARAAAQQPAEATKVAAEEQHSVHTGRSRAETLPHQSEQHSKRAA